MTAKTNCVGWPLCGVAPQDMAGLKVVDYDGDIGKVLACNVVRSPDPEDPSRTVYITIQWVRKGKRTEYHWACGWIEVLDNRDTTAQIQVKAKALAARRQAVYDRIDRMLPPQPQVVTKHSKSWFSKLREFFGI